MDKNADFTHLYRTNPPKGQFNHLTNNCSSRFYVIQSAHYHSAFLLGRTNKTLNFPLPLELSEVVTRVVTCILDLYFKLRYNHS